MTDKQLEEMAGAQDEALLDYYQPWHRTKVGKMRYDCYRQEAAAQHEQNTIEHARVQK